MAGSTLRDVARRAGVSIRTVSNVVNGSVPVSDELRVRVQAALDELDYRPNLVARNLRRGRSGMIALVVPELDVPYFAELAREVITAARTHGYVVMLDQTDGDGERERELLGRESRATMFDGLLLSPLSISADELRRRTNRVPVVLLGEHIFNGSFHHVAIDNVAAARDATEHLVGLGRRRIAAIGDQPYSTGETAQLRTAGYRQALEHAGLTVDEELIVPTPRFHRHLGAQAMERLLALPEPPDAVFCYNDLLAIGAMHALARAGVRVPEDIAVVGVDGIQEGRYSSPSLTTVAPDKAAIARTAVSTLLGVIDGSAPAPTEAKAPHRLLVRESTAGAPAD
ncbi:MULTISPECIES: LacI family DNA-binding transcriptional regulator [Streptomyces violaceoruber group]|uniref:LacI family DNA-binding transcriptional regulator n=2 Tax=Streptomyces violaceoruber group TaxID=2867121 RepID=A0ABT4PCC4_9ACTN|nr:MULTISPECIES: LacI family DNA-binding transcriptional regulator [Streptomyces anthocyanicus group]MCW8116079.1 LacI family transcriptional regulator [Streptomyces anthocyanicus]MCZ4638754.1 LacI family DNA-binding transcriptional regulator [Streptomyces rubrogriseus]WTC07381.1 LacI family transcriptional regulator [Streptomyces anthocyanicus]GHA23297.1 LacI family transcriptional regulator [Streptomyces anthocyanicus]